MKDEEIKELLVGFVRECQRTALRIEAASSELIEKIDELSSKVPLDEETADAILDDSYTDKKGYMQLPASRGAGTRGITDEG
jgi:hypothetical protein